MRIFDIDKLLKKSLSPKRYTHSVNVMHEALLLAKQNNVDVKKTEIAALLHDCGREISNLNIAKYAKKNGLDVLSIEEKEPVLLHSKVGAIIAKKKYGIEDIDVLRAISLHTTGDMNMTALDMIIFIADLIEPSRMQKGVDELRKVAKKDIEKAMMLALKQNFFYLSTNEKPIHPLSVSCWNDLLLKRGT